MDKEFANQVDLIREAFHYQSRFEGSTMVFKIEFPVTEDPLFPSLMKDLALLAKTGFKVVIVPGAKEWIDSVLAEYGVTTSYAAVPGEAGKVRVTTSQAIPFVEMAAFHVASRFMTFLSAGRVDAVVGNFVRARTVGVIGGLDTEHTGRVDKILTTAVDRLLREGMVPILPCIGYSPAGKPYNVSSDEIALAAASALNAVKLFIVTLSGGLTREKLHVPAGVETAENGRLVRITPQEGEALLAANKQTSCAVLDPSGAKTAREFRKAESFSELPALRELRLAMRASRAGVERVHIIDGREEGAVLRELFSNLGSGTMIYADEYESIRPLRNSDIPDVLRLMEPLMRKGFLLRRSAEQIQEKKDDYVVFEIDSSVHACGALHDWGEGQAEIAAIATDPAFTDIGLGRRIVEYLRQRAQKSGFRRVFVLTTQTQDWFELLGFAEAPVESLPERKRRVYDKQRRSKVFALDI